MAENDIANLKCVDIGKDTFTWLGSMTRASWCCEKRSSAHSFVQAAKVILMRPHNWPRFSFGEWLTRASERMHRNKRRQWPSPTSWHASCGASCDMASRSMHSETRWWSASSADTHRQELAREV